MRVIKGKASTVYIKEHDGRVIAEKHNDRRRKGYAKREFEAINNIKNLLSKRGYGAATYEALSHTDSMLVTSYVPGPTLEAVLQRGPWDKQLLQKMRELGEVFALVQQAYKSGEKTRRIFASGLNNFIVTEKAIVPIDLGTKKEFEHPAVQVARFLTYLQISCIRPWRRPPRQYLRDLEDAFLKGYCKKNGERLSVFKRGLRPFLLAELQRLAQRALKGEWGVKGLALLMLSLQRQRIVSSEMRADAQETITRFAKTANKLLYWSFYKADILQPHLAKDVDVVCKEDKRLVERAFAPLTRIGENAYVLDGQTFHIHYEGRTHTKFLFLWDLGPLILTTRIRTKKGWYRPSYGVWLFVRFIFMVKKPRKWLRKQFKRLFAPGRV